MLICILTKNVITSCSVTMMLFLHLEVKPLMTLTTVLYLSCALISGHLAMMLMELTKRRSEERRVGKECRSRWSTYDQKKKEARVDDGRVVTVDLSSTSDGSHGRARCLLGDVAQRA